MKSTFFLFLIAASSAQSAITQYTDRATFLAALPAHYLSTDFSDLTPGDQGVTTLTLFGSTPGAALLVEARNALNDFAGDNFWVSDLGDLDHALGAATTYSDQLRISGTFHAIGADWFLGDIDDNYLAGTVTLTFSDGSTYDISSTSQANSFRGFISDSPLTSVLVSPDDPVNVAGWATVDNLAIPEPSTSLLGAGGLLASALRRKRRA